MTTAAPAQVLTVDEVSACLRLTPASIRRLIRRGDLKALNVGGAGRGARYRITPTQLATYQQHNAA